MDFLCAQQDQHDRAPVVICGVGGSGTRVVARAVRAFGVEIGSCLNPALDNLWFTFLLRRREWQEAWPASSEITQALRLFARCSRGRFTVSDRAALEGEIARRGSEFRTEIRPEMADRALASLRALPDAPQRGLWGWKEPNAHLFLPQIARAFPRAKVILVMRDGCDMALSSNQNQLRHWAARFGLPPNPTPPVALEFWLRAHRRALAVLAQDFGPRALVLRYEDLCLTPLPVLQQLADFTGGQTTQTMLAALAGEIRQPRPRAPVQKADGIGLEQIAAARALHASYAYDTTARSVMRRQLVPSENAMTAPLLSSGT